MRIFNLSAFAFAGAILTIIVAPASAIASDNGLAYVIHQIEIKGDRSCMVGHYHFGDAKSRVSKENALRLARDQWSDFVALEYGTAWAHHSLSADRGRKCSKKGATYVCSVSSRPCKRGH